MLFDTLAPPETTTTAEARAPARLATETVVTAGASASTESATCTQEHFAVAMAITNTVDIQTDNPEALLELLTSGRLEITATEPDLPASSI